MTAHHERAPLADILIVDDTPANLELLNIMLKDRGYRVRAAISGQLALQAIEVEPPDVILLDIMMPRMDGYEVCERLKAQESTRHIPIIFISAMHESQNIIHAFEVGGVDYITKPFSEQEVIARVENHLKIVQQRRQLIESYETLDRLKSRFIRSATHDLKNPLNLIRGCISILKTMDYETFTDQGQQYVEYIDQGARQMQSLITDILDLAKLKTGTSLSPEPVSLEPFIVDTMAAFEVIAYDKRITLTAKFPDEEIIVQIDREQMRRALDNLLSNALKYTAEQGHVVIRMSKDETAGTVHISVRDNGQGIAEEDLDRIFDEFYRIDTPQNRQIEGTGLGLSIVKMIIEQHNGSIEVESGVDEGSDFRIVLPLE